ncbi:hypothetical protein ABSA28_01007 [Candidatus Hepatincolaceae symbiont of Richtersius coronifer]
MLAFQDNYFLASIILAITLLYLDIIALKNIKFNV